MSRLRTLAFIGLIAVIHFALMITLFISRMSCGMQNNCASAAGDLLRDVLAFPMNVVSLGLDGFGVDSNELIRRYLHGEIVVIFVLNSLLASVVIWLAAMKPLIRAVCSARRRASMLGEP